MDREVGHGRDIPGILRANAASVSIREVTVSGTRDGKPFDTTLCEIAGWDWIRDTQLHEAAMAALRTPALQEVMHDITALLAKAS